MSPVYVSVHDLLIDASRLFQMNKLLDVNSTLLQRTHELEEENMILRRRLGLDSSPSILEEISREAAIIKQEITDQLPNADSPRGIKSETSGIW